ncbi:MAG TPA: sodium:solute symporter [Verrucomicrobiae bacterium]|nr:sodium:solute symporter [Verrucomicrobiae bacterium]
MSALDYLVLIGSMLGIALYGMWKTRGRRDLKSYLKGDGQTPWFVIGLSVMATQASAITFLSTPGQGFQGGLGFVQIYFGMPIALIIIAAVFLPIYRRLGVYTAYEYLGKRFDAKTRLLGAGLFLLQRGLGAGLTIYAPAIVLSSMFHWSLQPTIICSGLLVIIYTVAGGSDAVTLTQKYQFGVIFAGMITAFVLVLRKLPAGLTIPDAFTLAGHFHKLQAVNYSTDPHERYTIWSGILGGTFLMLSYFGADQSQVQRYISGASLRESRLGLMFNAVCKIPMQFFILLLGVMIFVFYQFEQPPLFFDQHSTQLLASYQDGAALQKLETDYATAHDEKQHQLETWVTARHAGDEKTAEAAFAAASVANDQGDKIYSQAFMDLHQADPKVRTSEPDYVFITFILRYLPHGVIGLLVAAIFAAALSSKSAELNALGSTTTVDFYRHVINRNATDIQCVIASKWFTAFWGLFAIGFALYGHLSENLIQAVNILGSIFYGVILGLFVVAFFVRRVGGTAVFWSAVVTQTLVFVLYYNLTISYLWYPLIGCAVCVCLSAALQAILEAGGQKSGAHTA